MEISSVISPGNPPGDLGIFYEFILQFMQELLSSFILEFLENLTLEIIQGSFKKFISPKIHPFGMLSVVYYFHFKFHSEKEILDKAIDTTIKSGSS